MALGCNWGVVVSGVVLMGWHSRLALPLQTECAALICVGCSGRLPLFRVEGHVETRHLLHRLWAQAWRLCHALQYLSVVKQPARHTACMAAAACPCMYAGCHMSCSQSLPSMSDFVCPSLVLAPALVAQGVW
jgi:hypothetical protein